MKHIHGQTGDEQMGNTIMLIQARGSIEFRNGRSKGLDENLKLKNKNDSGAQ